MCAIYIIGYTSTKGCKARIVRNVDAESFKMLIQHRIVRNVDAESFKMLIQHSIARNVEAESLKMLIEIQHQGHIEEVVIPTITFHRDSSSPIFISTPELEKGSKT